MPKFEKSAADQALLRLDRIAAIIQQKYKAWGLPFDTARSLVNAIDKTADEIEVSAFGPESFEKRQIEVVTKSAAVIQRDSDEPYMETFKNPMAPIQTEADEPYMKAYADDQSSAVEEGKSTTGRPLVP